MHVSEDGQTLLAASQNLRSKHVVGAGYTGSSNAFQAWNLSGKRLRLTSLDADQILFAYSSFSPDGRLLVVPDGSIFDTTSGKAVLTLSVEGKLSLGMPVAISRDGAYAALGVFQPVTKPGWGDREMIGVQVWELATLLPVARLETGPLAHLAFTPDSRHLITAGPEALQLWDIASAKVLTQRKAPARVRGSYGDSFVSSMALAPDGHTVATGHVDTTILLWDLPAPASNGPAAPMKAGQLSARWDDLASADAGRAFASIARLADMPEQAVEFMRDRLHPVKAPSSEEFGRLIADLDSPQFARREAATKQLTELGELADAALRKALSKTPPLEVQRRIEALLARPPLTRTPDARRNLRAVRVMEAIGTANAQDLLKMLSTGAPDARLTQEAKAALDRLAKKSAAAP